MSTVAEIRSDFHKLYVAQVKGKLLNKKGAYLSFMVMCTGIDALAYFYAGIKKDPLTGKLEREENKDVFNRFVNTFLSSYSGVGLWDLRNSLVHSFIPHKRFFLTYKEPEIHRKRMDGGQVGLSAELMFKDFKAAANDYFDLVASTPAEEMKLNDVCSIRGVIEPAGTGMYMGVTYPGTNQQTFVHIPATPRPSP